jgi:type I restriction enzyme M protein
MRTKLIESNMIDCIIGLGPNLFYNSPMESCVVICKKNRPFEKAGKILFINAVREVTRKNTNSFLSEEQVSKIANTYHNYQDVESFAKVVTFREISENGYDLSIKKYVFIPKKDEVHETISFPEALSEWDETQANVRYEIESLIESLS